MTKSRVGQKLPATPEGRQRVLAQSGRYAYVYEGFSPLVYGRGSQSNSDAHSIGPLDQTSREMDRCSEALFEIHLIPPVELERLAYIQPTLGV